mmetsp:Transcript_47855/g.137273  ORF Transcript_47855/g.137273 Transcript_47855/m.137273 type:complete len:261 (-) Transcript_47855:1104-1886(-)
MVWRRQRRPRLSQSRQGHGKAANRCNHVRPASCNSIAAGRPIVGLCLHTASPVQFSPRDGRRLVPTRCATAPSPQPRCHLWHLRAAPSAGCPRGGRPPPPRTCRSPKASSHSARRSCAETCRTTASPRRPVGSTTLGRRRREPPGPECTERAERSTSLAAKPRRASEPWRRRPEGYRGLPSHTAAGAGAATLPRTRAQTPRRSTPHAVTRSRSASASDTCSPASTAPKSTAAPTPAAARRPASRPCAARGSSCDDRPRTW